MTEDQKRIAEELTENLAKSKESVESYYERVERQSTEAVVNAFKKIRKQKEMENEQKQLNMTHIKDMKRPEKSPDEEKIMDIALGGPQYFPAYYTPSMEDIKVGYECENLVEIQQSESIVREWRRIVVKKHIIKYMLEWIDIGKLKTPYLSKEQIKEEGWEVKETHWSGSNFSFEKGNIMGIQLRDKRIALILKDVILDDFTERTSNGQIYLGNCPSINEFRYISKLLGL